MKKTVTIYSLFLLAGTAMAVSTMQQPRVDRHSMSSHQQWGDQRASGDVVCEDAGIFSNYAYELEVNSSCTLTNYYYEDRIRPRVLHLDIDEDGALDSISGEASYNKDEKHGNTYRQLHIIRADSATSFSASVLLDPSTITYEGLDFNDIARSALSSLVDMNGDGLLDAILAVKAGGQRYFCAINISPPPTANCTSDVNGDGSVGVNDILQVVGNWGPCE